MNDTDKIRDNYSRRPRLAEPEIPSLCDEVELLRSLLRRVHEQAGNGAPEHKRHALTPGLRDEIETLLEGPNE